MPMMLELSAERENGDADILCVFAGPELAEFEVSSIANDLHQAGNHLCKSVHTRGCNIFLIGLVQSCN